MSVEDSSVLLDSTTSLHDEYKALYKGYEGVERSSLPSNSHEYQVILLTFSAIGE